MVSHIFLNEQVHILHIPRMDFVAPLLFLFLFAIPLLYKTGFIGTLSGGGSKKSRPRPPIFNGDGTGTGIRKMIIDTDAGVDDAGAILLALSRYRVDVVAITTVFGNVARDKVVINVNRVLRLFPEKKKMVPIYAGAEDPMNPPPGYQPPWSKRKEDDGLGNKPEIFPEKKESDKNAAVLGKHAADAIFEHIRDNADCIIVCLGPLTNLALAIQRHPELATHRNLTHVYIMGANIPTVNKASAGRTFNFALDPDAVSIILTKLKRPVTFVAGVAQSGLNSSKEFEEQYMDTRTRKGAFVKATRAKFLKHIKRPTLKDELTMAAAIDPSIIENWQKMEQFVAIELEGDMKGRLVFDDKSSNPKQNVQFVSKLNWRKAEQMLLDAVQHE